MPIPTALGSKQWSQTVLVTLCIFLAGCGLANKNRTELAQKPVESGEEEEAAPLVLASEYGTPDPLSGDLGEASPAMEPPIRPSVIPAGAIEPSSEATGTGPVVPHANLVNSVTKPDLQATPPIQRKVLVADADDFSDVVLKSQEIVLVDFYADWCGPCKKQAPILEKYAKNAGDVRVVKVNTDKSRRVAREYGIRKLPTLMVFRGGKPIDKHSGLVNEASLKKFVDEAKAE